MAKTALHITGDAEADTVLSRDPLALLIGMVLDQQVTMEKAFSSPAELARRLGGSLDAATIAAMEPEELAEVFKERPALHRFPGVHGGAGPAGVPRRRRGVRRQGRCDLEGRPSGDELVDRLKSLPGFGEQKSKIFAALLGKQLGVRPEGWRAATAPYGGAGTFLSVADITDAASLEKVRATKKAMKARARGGA